MRSLGTKMAAMLMGLAVVAFQFDAQAQERRSGSVSRSTPSSAAKPTTQVTRPASQVSKPNTSASKPSTQVTKPAVTKPSTSVSKPSTQVTKPSTSVTKPSTQVTRPSTTVRPSAGVATDKKPGTAVTRPQQPSTSVTRPATRPSAGTAVKPADRPQTKPADKPQTKPADQNRPITVTRPGHRPGDRQPGGSAMRPDMKPSKPVQIRPDHKPEKRVHPRDRDFMHYSAPSYYWTGYNHYYGHRVRVLPTHAHRHVYHGVTYYCYNDIWYRSYGGYYVVCRPPFGTSLAASVIADMTWAAVTMSYYQTVANTYSQITENNRYIAEQNEIIAQNNAIIASQNLMIEQTQAQAQAAYTLAAQLGLVQSYADAGQEYYYQDGVFYAKDSKGDYYVIVPPAGALVETLPEDYDIVVLADGNEYYKVDYTIYRVTIIEGKPYFEVLGQLYS
ncbi:MAG: hypothetical protein IKW27_00875 [Bacteroidales bacterium]|nr:hypothetical protein [Bacteroidales bacterium]